MKKVVKINIENMNYPKFVSTEILFLLVGIIFTTNITHGVDFSKFSKMFSTFKEKEDYYSSLIGVQNLAKKEQEIIAKLVDYKSKLAETLELIDNYLDDYNESIAPIIKENQELKAKSGEQDYPVFNSEKDLQWISEQISSNPLAVFKLIRRFAAELSDIRERINNHSDFTEYINGLSSDMKVPKTDDLNGAADGLLRLQETYHLPTDKMGAGIILEKKTYCRLLASDMLFIGVYAVNQERFATGIEWLYLAYQKVLEGDDSLREGVAKEHLLTARNLHNEEFLKFRATPSNLFSNLVSPNFTNVPHMFIRPVVWEYPLGLETDSIYDIYNYNALCRGEELLSPQEIKKLRCWYSKSNSLFNILSPLKMEMHHQDPPVFQIHDVISDKIINRIKDTSLPVLKRAMVLASGITGRVKSDVRTSSVAWLADRNSSDSLLRGVSRIVKRATGLECDSEVAAEDLQVSCYGSVGGYYIPHLDALNHPGVAYTPFVLEEYTHRRGDRVATLMFYLSDVELGGGTAFPRLGVAVKPVKGSAVTWYNLKLNGNRDLLTLHGGCPVLYGNKWVANKWIRLFDQLHLRKCSRDQSE